MAQLQLKRLLGQVNALLEKNNNFFGQVLVNKAEMQELIKNCVDSIPADVKEAEMIISRRDEIIREAQNRAERIIQDAITEQNRLVSDNEISRKVHDELTKQKQRVDEYCDNLQNAAAKNAEEIKIAAVREAARINVGAEDYAERVFNTLASNITEVMGEMNQILNNVNICQKALAEKRNQTVSEESQEEQQEQEYEEQ